MKNRLFLLLTSLIAIHSFTECKAAASIPSACQVVSTTPTYDTFQQDMQTWVNTASGPEKTRRSQIVTALSQIMSDHNFKDGGVTFSQFQRFLQSPYQPNLPDIYYLLNKSAQAPVSQDDVAQICTSADIPAIQANSLDLILYGLADHIYSGNLSPLDVALFQRTLNWVTGTDAKTITIDDFLQTIEADPNEDCDSILNNLDSNGVAQLINLVQAAIPGWQPSPRLATTASTKT